MIIFMPPVTLWWGMKYDILNGVRQGSAPSHNNPAAIPARTPAPAPEVAVGVAVTAAVAETEAEAEAEAAAVAAEPGIRA